MPERLDKFISGQGGFSRSDAKKLISSGAVTVDGVLVRQASASIDPERSEVAVRGRAVSYRRHLYVLLNKPLGVVSSTDDPESPTVLSLLPPGLSRRGIFPAGRLDKYSEGMLILTDDGAFAHRMLSPKNHVPKTYYVEVDAPRVDEALAEEFSKGVYLGGGERSSPAILEILGPKSAYVTITEGIYHQVRRMFDQNGAKVTRLKRVRIGGLALDPALLPGECRELTAAELEAIRPGILSEG